MRRHRVHCAFTLVEVMVMVLLLGIVMAAASMVFICGQNLFATTSSQSDLQASVIQSLRRVSFELQDSGRGSDGTSKVSILDNAGLFTTDILRFSIPVCVCGVSPIDADGNVAAWGAPLVWGQNGCDLTYAVNNNKVSLCHFPSGNSSNATTLDVNLNAVKAHLAHGDYIGACNACSTTGYTNRRVEYLVNSSNQLLRRVLNASDVPLNSTIIGQKVTGFQAVVNADQNVITITVQATGMGAQRRSMVISNSVDVLLRNW